MPSDSSTPAPPPEKSVTQHLQDWGESSLPPALLATLVTALHARPLRLLPLTLFVPPLLFSSYLNLAGLTTASAGLTAAWSGLYALLAFRRRPPLPPTPTGAGVGSYFFRRLRGKFSTRGLVRGSAVGLGAVNALSAGWVYARGDFRRDDERRRARNRWG